MNKRIIDSLYINKYT